MSDRKGTTEIIKASPVTTGTLTQAGEGGELTIEQTIAAVNKVLLVVDKVMQQGKADGQGDYGVIPGTGERKTLFKSGAEKLCLTFRLGPTYEVHEERGPGDHLRVNVTCKLHHIPTGNLFGAGVGSCSTFESKYRWRKAELQCPDCGKETIFRSKPASDGFYCWRKRGGCGATFGPGEPAIVSQNPGRVENPDLADAWNTVLKMACKRALVAAVLNCTAASSIFTQDMLEEPPPAGDSESDEPPPREPRNGNGGGNGRNGGHRDSDRRPSHEPEREREPAPASRAEVESPLMRRERERRERAAAGQAHAASPAQQLDAAKQRTAAVVEAAKPAPVPERNDDSERATVTQLGDYGLDGDEAIDPPAPEDNHRSHDDDDRAAEIAAVINLPGQWETLRDRAIAAGCAAPDLLMLIQQHFQAATCAKDLPGRGSTRTDAYVALEDHVERCERAASVKAKG